MGGQVLEFLIYALMMKHEYNYFRKAIPRGIFYKEICIIKSFAQLASNLKNVIDCQTLIKVLDGQKKVTKAPLTSALSRGTVPQIPLLTI